MAETNQLLREILQEIREVKAHVIPSPATRHSVLASAGGGPSVQNILSQVASASSSEKAQLQSLPPPPASAKRPNKVEADLYFNPAMDCYINREGKCFYADLNETTLDPVPNMSRMIGKLRPGVNREQAQESNFVASNARSRKRKNRRNRTRKN